MKLLNLNVIQTNIVSTDTRFLTALCPQPEYMTFEEMINDAYQRDEDAAQQLRDSLGVAIIDPLTEYESYFEQPVYA